MFGSQVFEMVIGLVFVYLTASLIVTAMNEMIATWTQSRGKMLERAIRNFLANNSNKLPDEGTNENRNDSWARALLDHPLISSMAQNNANPSYIPGDTFARALIDLVVKKAQVPDAAGLLAAAERSAAPADFAKLRQLIAGIDNDHVKQLLLPLLDKVMSEPAVGSAVRELADEIESWYDQAMDRVSGWYKRRTQNVLLVLAVAVAFVGNIDTMAVWQSLGDVKTRASLVAAAEAATKQPPAQSGSREDVGAAYRDLRQQIADAGRLGIPIGWHWDSAANHQVHADNLYDVLTSRLFLSKFIGLLLTAVAASLGAPFWFDMLKYIMSIRAAGKAPEEEPIPPKEVPKPQEPEKPTTVSAQMPPTPGKDGASGMRDLLADVAARNPITGMPPAPKRVLIIADPRA